MKTCFKFFSFTLLFLLLSSCGADKLKSKIATSTSQSSLTASCQCNTADYIIPVCDSDGDDYPSACVATCFGAKVTSPGHTGHCDCSSNPNMVCGSDGKDYSECDAKALEKSGTIQITKYIPCAATPL